MLTAEWRMSRTGKGRRHGAGAGVAAVIGKGRRHGAGAGVAAVIGKQEASTRCLGGRAERWRERPGDGVRGRTGPGQGQRG